LKKFARQVYQFGIARPILNQRHPNYAKLTFWFPSMFLMYFSFCFLTLIFSFFNENYWTYTIFISFPFVIYLFLIFANSTIENNIKVGFLAIITTLIQFICYGSGFLKSWIWINLMNKQPEEIFPNHFHL